MLNWRKDRSYTSKYSSLERFGLNKKAGSMVSDVYENLENWGWAVLDMKVKCIVLVLMI